MTDNNDKIDQLLVKLDSLLKRQDDFSKEIDLLRLELNKLKNVDPAPSALKEEVRQEMPTIQSGLSSKSENTTPTPQPIQQQVKQEQPRPTPPPVNKPPQVISDIEKFIGENLINKIGIAITVIGVAIGAKYSIDNGLISPLTRIILGYLFGLGLLGFGIKLKRKYENYSAVLVSGSMAIMYFITYAAYGFYDLIPQMVAFALMLVFTVFTVIAAINYNRQEIAHIGLVGAYAVPFLLSDGSGNVAVLFSYMTILNMGILAVAFKKYWKPLYFVSFGLTWVVFLSWCLTEYRTNEHFGLALTFASIFFLIFYLTFLVYKLLQKEKFVVEDVILVMSNSFIYYGFGYGILYGHETGKQLLGVFTLFIAIVHFIVSVIIYRQKLSDKNILYLIAGLVLVFITIAVPVQLDGNWVTMLWAGEAALLFWIGRTKVVSFYELLSYPLMLLAFLSILHDWSCVYNVYNPEIPSSRITTLFNVNFLTSILFIAAFGFINFLNRKRSNSQNAQIPKDISSLVSYAVPGILILAIYVAFRLEIANYWNQLYTDSAIRINTGNDGYPEDFWNYDLRSFKTIWIINYSLLFVSALSFVNLRKLKNSILGFINLGLLVLVLGAFLTLGLYELSELRESYLQQPLSKYYQIGIFNLWMRYISFPFAALALFAGYKYIKEFFLQKEFKIAFELLLHATILWITSSELINWMDVYHSEQSYKLGLSILWGLYSLFLISFGIWKKNKPMRIGAIALFGITLIKLFVYDIAHLDTISKTIVFVSLGVLLLIISFLYNKYKHLISEDENDN